MDRAVVGEQAVVAAMSFVRIGATVPPRTLVAGIPAKVVRELSDEEVRGKHAGTLLYQELAARSAGTMQAVRALEAPEADRARSDWAEVFARLGVKG
jgi:phenylacetic acid degradation protein